MYDEEPIRHPVLPALHAQGEEPAGFLQRGKGMCLVAGSVLELLLDGVLAFDGKRLTPPRRCRRKRTTSRRSTASWGKAAGEARKGHRKLFAAIHEPQSRRAARARRGFARGGRLRAPGSRAACSAAKRSMCRSPRRLTRPCRRSVRSFLEDGAPTEDIAAPHAAAGPQRRPREIFLRLRERT